MYDMVIDMDKGYGGCMIWWLIWIRDTVDIWYAGCMLTL